MCSKYSHPFEFRLTRFTRRLSQLFTFHSQGGLFLRPTYLCVQNSKFTGKVCFYTGFFAINFAISFGGCNVSAGAGKTYSHSRASARGEREHLFWKRAFVLQCYFFKVI